MKPVDIPFVPFEDFTPEEMRHFLSKVDKLASYSLPLTSEKRERSVA